MSEALARLLLVSVAAACLATRVSADTGELTPAQAASHVGEAATVCGVVVEGSYRPDVRGEPTFLNFGHRHPDQLFTALIWGEHRARFRSPPERLESQSICVTGRIKLHRGKPQIEVDSPAQLEPNGSP